MPRRLTDQDLQDVLDLIPNAQYGGRIIRADVIAYRLGLTMAQVYYRVRRLRKLGIVVTDGDKVDRVPLLSFASGESGYILSNDPKDNAKHRRWRSKTGLTIFELTFKESVERFIATLPPVERPVMRRKLERAWVRILEDLGDLVAANNAVLASV